MNKRFMRTALPLALLLAALLTACGNNTSTSSTGNGATTVTSGASTTGGTGATTMAGGTTTSAAGSMTTSAAGTPSGAMTTSGTGDMTTSAAGTTSAMGSMTTSAADTTSASGAMTTSAAGNMTTSASGAMTTSAAGNMTTSASGSMTTSAAGSMTTSAAGGAATPNSTPVGTSGTSATVYPNAINTISLPSAVEGQFAKTLAPNLSNAAALVFTTKDDPATVATFFNQKLTGLGYTASNAQTSLPVGLKGQTATFICSSGVANGSTGDITAQSNALSPSGCNKNASGTAGAGATAGTKTTATGVQLVAVGPLDSTTIGLLSSQAQDLGRVLTPGNTVVMLFTGQFNGQS